MCSLMAHARDLGRLEREESWLQCKVRSLLCHARMGQSSQAPAHLGSWGKLHACQMRREVCMSRLRGGLVTWKARPSSSQITRELLSIGRRHSRADHDQMCLPPEPAR